MRPSQLGPGAESDLIRRLAEAVGTEVGAEVLLGIGDDAAVVRLGEGERLVASSDMAVEEIHFRRAWLRWETVGWRATAAALSDLAAMAARPVGMLLSIALPPELEASVLEELGRGVGACLREHGGALIGGDLSRSPGPVVVDAVALGAAERPMTRGGGRPGDELWVTGALGGAAAAIADWTEGLEPDPAARRAFERPSPRLQEARWLVARGHVTALIDLSDGLATDAGHLAAASSSSAVLETEAVPRAEVLGSWADESAALARVVGGGEDFELLLAVGPGTLEEHAGAFRREFGLRLTRVGRLEEGRGVRWLGPEGEVVPPPGRGWDHFAPPEP